MVFWIPTFNNSSTLQVLMIAFREPSLRTELSRRPVQRPHIPLMAISINLRACSLWPPLNISFLTGFSESLFRYSEDIAVLLETLS